MVLRRSRVVLFWPIRASPPQASWRSRLFAVVTVAAVVATACFSGSARPQVQSHPAQRPLHWWAETSPFNAAIPPNVAVNQQSAAWAQMLYESAGHAGLYINDDSWTTTVYVARVRTPRKTFSITNTRSRITIPYDPRWKSSPDSDSHIAIIDRRNGCDYEFQRFDATAGTALGEGTYRIFDGSGAHLPTGHTGAALSLLAGLIRPSDIRNGVIRHALAFGAPVTGTAFVPPGTSSDGRVTAGPPEGTRFQLDPGLDLSSLKLSPVQLIVAQALQRYGMYLRDTAGAVALYAQSRADGSTYAQPLQALPRDLLLHLRAVMPPAGTTFDERNPSGCARQVR